MSLLQGDLVMSSPIWHAVNDKHNIALMERDGVIKLVNMDMSREKTGFHCGTDIRDLPLDSLIAFFPECEDILIEYMGLKTWKA